MPLAGLDSVRAEFRRAPAQRRFLRRRRSTRPSPSRAPRSKPPATSKLRVTGDLTVHGVTKPVVLDVTINKARRAADGQARRGRLRRHHHDQAQRVRPRTSTCPNVSDEVKHPHHHRSAGAEGRTPRSKPTRMIRPPMHGQRAQLRAACNCVLAKRAARPEGWLDSRHTFSFGSYYDPAVDGLRPAAGDQRGPRRARCGFPAASPRQHGNPQLRARGRAGAQGRQRRRRRDPRRRTAVDERRPRHRAQRVQRLATASRCTSCRSGSSPIALNAPAGLCAARRVDRPMRGRWALLASPDGADGSSAIRQDAWLRGARLDAGRDRIEHALDPARRYWLQVGQGRSRPMAACSAAGDALGLARRSRHTARCRRRRHWPRCCCSTCRRRVSVEGTPRSLCWQGRARLSLIADSRPPVSPRAAARMNWPPVEVHRGAPYNAGSTLHAAHARHDRSQRPSHPGQRREALQRDARRPAAELPAAVDGVVELASARVPADRGRARSASARTAARISSSKTDRAGATVTGVRRMTAAPLTVVQLLPALESGGVERSTLEIADALVRAGHRAIVVSAGGRLVPQLQATGRRTHRARHRPQVAADACVMCVHCARCSRASSVDIVHARSRLPAWLGGAGVARACAGAAAPAFRHHRARPEFALALQRGHDPRRTRDLRVRHACATTCCGITRDTDAGKLRVIPRGIDPPTFPRASHPDRDARAWAAALHPALGGDGPLLLLPGRGTRLKGHADALALLAAVARRWHRCAPVVARCARSGARGLYRRTRTRGRRRLAFADAVALHRRPPTQIARAYAAIRPGAAAVAQTRVVRSHGDRGACRSGARCWAGRMAAWANCSTQLQPQGAVAPFDADALQRAARELLTHPPSAIRLRIPLHAACDAGGHACRLRRTRRLSCNAPATCRR